MVRVVARLLRAWLNTCAGQDAVLNIPSFA